MSFSANSKYDSFTFETKGAFKEPAPAIFAPFIAAGRRTVRSKLSLAVMCPLHLKSVKTAVTPRPNPPVENFAPASL